VVYFRVSKNINIKLTDGSLLKFSTIKSTKDIELDEVYLTSSYDIEAIKGIFSNVGSEYNTLDEDKKRFSSLKAFPKEVGMIHSKSYKDSISNKISFFANEVDILKQIITTKKEIKLAIVGGVGQQIGEMISAYKLLDYYIIHY
jgi:hypothetical protein